MPGAKFSDDAFYAVGAFACIVIAVKILLFVFRLLRICVWSRIGSNKDYVATFGKWAVITGGSDGIGRGFAMELARRGMNVCILSNRENDVVSEIREKYSGVKVRYVDVDFSSPDVYERVEKELKHLDDIGILINNVGMVQPKWQPLVEQSRGFLKKIMNVNMTAMVCLTEIVLKGMIEKNKGLIVNMSSLSSVVPLSYATMYSATKGFVDNYSVCLAAELNETNVRVKCIRPSFVRTTLLKDMGLLTGFLRRNLLLKGTFPGAGRFAASVVATFGSATPVLYSGYWTHELLNALVPYTAIGKERISALSKSATRWLTGEV